MKAALPVITFVLRHALAVPLAIAAGCVLWTAAYVLLLLWAVVFGGGLGGPLAYPAGIFAVVVGGALIGWGIFAPACAVGALFCGVTGWPRFAAFPVVFIGGILFGYMILRNHALFLAVPLGVYWWATEGPGAACDALRRWWERRRLRAG
jgi:hypothetical protein